MAVTKIPAKEVITCDRCKASGSKYDQGPFHSGGVHGTYESWGRSWGGDTGGSSGIRLDLCQDCSTAFFRFMEAK